MILDCSQGWARLRRIHSNEQPLSLATRRSKCALRLLTRLQNTIQAQTALFSMPNTLCTSYSTENLCWVFENKTSYMKVFSFIYLSITAEQNCAGWVRVGPIPSCLFVKGATRQDVGDLGLILVAIFHHFHLLWTCLAVKKITAGEDWANT